MTARLGRAFARARETGGPALVAYLVAGHPDRERALAYARAVLAEVDVLELGVPFSDPVADGPVIERAAVEALARGARLQDAFDLTRALRAESDKPIVLMTYYNPVYQRGLARFAAEARDAGADAVILPDVPLEESDEPGRAFAAHDLHLVQLASPATPEERLARLAAATRGFLYVVSSFGVTGARESLAPETEDLVARSRKACGGKVPLAVGFGVSNARQARLLHAAGADGVIVGSAIVSRIQRGDEPADVARFVASLRP